MTGQPWFVVRPAVAGDLDALVDLFASVVEERLWLGAEPPLDRAAQRRRFVERMEEGGPGESLVAVSEEGSEMIGHVGMDLAPYNVASLGMIVGAEWRGRGVGAALVDAAVDWSRHRGAHKLTLQVWPHNTVARRLYRRHGFVEEGVLRRHYRRRSGELWDAVVMGLVLDETSPGSSLPSGDRRPLSEDPVPTWSPPSP
ncbi:MAG: GNAT family N-acetyltransferase [Actinomycetota bacterium]|nr:GNAT family N-acetyltransferase [Actinomycetota bacterium]